MCKNTGPQGPEGGSGMRIVVKVGTSTLAHATGRLNIQRMERLCRVLSDLKMRGMRSFWCPPAPSAWAWGS